jgi:hypothetical protein
MITQLSKAERKPGRCGRVDFLKSSQVGKAAGFEKQIPYGN